MAQLRNARPRGSIPELENITRFDYPKYHGWRVQFKRGKHTARKYFHDVKGQEPGVGSTLALKAAIAFRDSVKAKLPYYSRSGGYARPLGYGYVTKYVRYYKRADGYVAQPCWKAWVKVAHTKYKATHYSIKCWGSKLAKELATAWLKRQQSKVGYMPAESSYR